VRVVVRGRSGFATLGRHVVDVAQCFVNQRGDVRIEEPLDDGAPVSIADDEAKVP
jgi:hypothetical protein